MALAVARWALPLAALAFHAATAPGYGVFRDELYYFACARRLDWGYVDHPPGVALLAALVRALFGESWIAARLLTAGAAAATILLVGDTTHALGGGRWARLLAQGLTAAAPVYLAIFSIFSMNAFDVLVWAGLVRVTAQALAGGSPRLWLLFGALAGLGLETKLDVGLLMAGLAVGLVVARRFEFLWSSWFWIGAAIAAALFLPHVLWQARHGWPTLEFVANAQRVKIAHLGPMRFAGEQFLQAGPVGFALALGGLGWLLAARRARPFRALGWAAVVVFIVLAGSVSKPYYFAPALTILFPAAGAAIEAWTPGRAAGAVRLVIMLLAASTLAAAPLAKPILSEDAYVRYAAALGMAPASDEKHRLGRLPQFFADMHGWRALAETVAGVAAHLPPEERTQACVYANNYGEAAAIDFFRAEFSLPPAISGHNNYWLWGPGACSGTVLIIIGGNREQHERWFRTVEQSAVLRCADCMPSEDNLPIWVGRGARLPPAAIWPATRHYD